MKNLFILPSEKPSRLLKSQNNNFMIIKSDTPNWFEIILKNTYQNIYIINDDEIKDNTWVLNIVNGNIYKTYKGKPFNKDTKKEKWRKIIIATDVDLIKDGVPAINDQVLDWFVKNPTCEWVDIDSWADDVESYQPKTFKELFANTAIIAETDEFGNLNYKFKANMKEDLLPKINLIDDWLQKNSDPQITKQVENEAKELCEKQTAVEYLLSVAVGENVFDDLEIKQAKEIENKEKGYTEEEVLEFTQTMIMQYKFGNTNIEQMDLLKENLQQFKTNKIWNRQQ
jgi:hypothetical protein